MTSSGKIEVELPPDLARFVHLQVGQGTLVSESDVLCDLVRQAAQRDALLDETRRKIAAGVASLRAGVCVDGETFMAALDAELLAIEGWLEHRPSQPSTPY